MKIFFLITAVFVAEKFTFSLCQRSPTISYISQEQIKDIGGNAEIVCSVSYAEEYPVLWSKTDKKKQTSLLISTGTTLILKSERFKIRHVPASMSYVLTINDLQETDAGVYQCQVIITLQNKITAETDLVVRRPPVISDNSTRSLVVSEGQSIQLECYANGFPPPKVSWRRENNRALATGASIYRGNVLKIANITKDDRGTYYCTAENGVGRGAGRHIAVEVEFPPSVKVVRPRLGQALQYDMDLECHIEAYPPPAVIWMKDDVALTNNQHYSISQYATADELTDTTLRVITIEKRQYGKYQCKAANKLGSSAGEVELFETVIPVCPPACNNNYYGK
ncbi:unnamed protein product [Bemisia tabaci]|uniref:Ig-like domain-containing protein n=1 Tax=Bemisia tabaci TaxID=7038 RepID=A0A9P0A6U1_BEMTA|nr:PREDICTED: lachesin [Bemisia tabaci]CAH0384372.1 unnamed protein product [Bemisia tabaci]